MRYLITLAAAVFITTMSCAQTVEHLFLPNVLFKSDASIFSFDPQEDYIRNYGFSEYSITYDKSAYKLGINFMETPGSMEELSKSINAEIEASSGIKVYTNEMYKNFLLIQILDGGAAAQDSVRASHILLEGNANDPAEYQMLLAKADSLRNVILAKNNFAQLAAIYGTDGTKDRGGDLGWFTKGKMVKPFEDACFNGNVGDIQVITTQFGVHLVQINAKKLASQTPEETGSFIELALTIANGDFIISYNGMFTKKSDLSLDRLKKLIDSSTILTPEEADDLLKYPMTESMFVAAQTQAYQEQDENLYYALNTLFMTQFNFSEYFQLRRNYRTAYYSLSDFLDMIFNEDGKSELVRLRVLSHVGPDMEEIVNTFPNWEDKFYNSVGSELFKDSVYVAYVGITNLEQHIVAVNYYSMITEKPYTEIFQFTPSPNGWISKRVELPKELSGSNPETPAWDFESNYSSDIMVVNAWKANKYYIKSNSSNSNEWATVDQLPEGSTNFVMIEVGAELSNEIQYSNRSFHFPKTTGKGAVELDKVARMMTENGETYSCDEAMDMLETDNVEKLTNGQCCMDYTLANNLKTATGPELRAISSGLRAENIDADSEIEYFVFYVSNGKVIGANGVDFQNGKAVNLDKKVILKYLKTNKQASNLCLYSMMKY
ncbi:MAG: hypothetical protein RL204_283 [Bacteroidota bacterium]|jgi:hypothetical protein